MSTYITALDHFHEQCETNQKVSYQGLIRYGNMVLGADSPKIAFCRALGATISRILSAGNRYLLMVSVCHSTKYVIESCIFSKYMYYGIGFPRCYHYTRERRKL